MIIDHIVLVKSDWEKNERAFLNNLILEKKDDEQNNNNNNDDCIIDVGSNIEYYTILFAKRYYDHKIISIEASKEIFKDLKKNCNLNGINSSKVRLINKAAFDIDNKKIEFYEIESMSTTQKDFFTNLPIPKNNNDNNQLSNYYKQNVVETITIDSIVLSENIDNISLIKIDVEDAEILTLKGAIETLQKKKIKMMMIEYHSLENYNYIIKLLRELGYSISYSSKHRPAIHKDPKYVNGHIIAKLIE
jgi:FkbM family methyltransferase